MRNISIYTNGFQNVKDYILIAEIRNGNERAFTELFDRYYLKLVNTLAKNNSFGPRENIEDAVLDAFIETKIKIENKKYEEQSLFFAYVKTIAFRALNKERLKNKEDLSIEDHLKSLEAEIFENNIEREYYYRKLEEAKKEIDWLCRELIEAQYGIIKTSDQEIYNDYPDQFTRLANVRNKRNKCLDKLKKIADKLK